MPSVQQLPPEVAPSPRQRRKVLNKAETEVKAEKRVSGKEEAAPVWGRHNGGEFRDAFGTLLMILFCPLLVVVSWIAFDSFNGSLLDLAQNYQTLLDRLPKPTVRGFALYFGWVLFQGLLYAFVPGKIGYGQRTPAGLLLPYNVNGLKAWAISHIMFVYGSLHFKVFSPSIIADNWGALLIATNVYGYALAIFAYAKAYLAPSHPEDCKFSGSRIYDFWMGIEFNPRFGKLWDFKLFHNGRPGIIGWTLINFSFAAAQYKKFGLVTNSMVLVNVLQAIYVLDFFLHEDWYLRTIDIAHDHFGFMLSWGDSTWLPFMYTLQAQYLVKTPFGLSNVQFYLTSTLGVLGYLIFRLANNQKDLLRSTKGQCDIWGRPATFIRANYKSADGQVHESLLLTSGFWGLSRHFNYLADLMLSLAMCMTCGFRTLLPYFYFVYMTLLLLHRINRDQLRCQLKYGKYWDQYCQEVPYKLIPFVY